MDLLADALRISGARGSLGTRLEAGGSWGLWLDGSAGATVHAVSTGTMWLDLPGERPLRLDTGDVVLLPPGTAHGLSGEPGVVMGPCDRDAAARARSVGRVVRLGSPPVLTRLLTLHFEQDPEVTTPVLTALTAPMRVAARDNPTLEVAVRLLSTELARPQIGSTAAVNSIIDLLLVQFVRAWPAGRSSHPPPGSAAWSTRSCAMP